MTQPHNSSPSLDGSHAVASARAHASAAVRALDRAIDVRTAAVGTFLQAPFRRCPPRVYVISGPLADMGLYPTSTRTVPSGMPKISHCSLSSIEWLWFGADAALAYRPVRILI